MQVGNLFHTDLIALHSSVAELIEPPRPSTLECDQQTSLMAVLALYLSIRANRAQLTQHLHRNTAGDSGIARLCGLKAKFSKRRPFWTFDTRSRVQLTSLLESHRTCPMLRIEYRNLLLKFAY